MENTMKFLAFDSTVKLTCVNTTQLVKKAKEIHNLSKTATAAFGRLLTMGAMMGADLKEDNDNITLQVKGNGPIGTMICVCKKGAKVKGYLQNPSAEIKPKDNGKLDVSGVVGTEGNIYIIKDIGLKEPYVGVSNIITGEIAEDFTNYFATSEQVPTVIALGVSFDENNEVKASGGFFLQLMPDAKMEVIDILEENLKDLPNISQLVSEYDDLYEIAKIITKDEDILSMLGTIENDYLCECNKERIKGGIISLGKDEIKQIVDEEEDIQTKCQFCNKEYTFTKQELKDIYDNM